MTTTIVEQCQVAPLSGAPTEQLLKLLHVDILFLHYPPLKSLLFYSFQCSESHFLDTIVPNLKNSLSLTLKHFPPMAGKLVIPINSDNNSMPVSHYVAGQDYFPLTIAISNADFVNLTGYQSRDNDQFLDFVPQLPRATISDSSTAKFPVAAVQVTLFPNQGVCVGFTIHHAICDGATGVRLMKMWASINRFNGDDSHLLALGEKCLPFYERDVIRDGDRLAMESWSYMKTLLPTTTTTLSSAVSLPTHAIRATFVLSRAQIQKLKNLIPAGEDRVSSFTVACAHLWTCLARSAAAAGEEVADDEPEYFCIPVDCRRRLDPPLPDTYFGNCSKIVIADSTNGKLKGGEGFLAAAKAIGEAIQKGLSDEKGIMDGSLKSFQELLKGIGKRMHLVAGSPGFDYYTADYGWGRPIKFDYLQSRVEVSFFGKSRESQGGIEICVLMPKFKMDAFAAFFNQGLTTDMLWCKL
ncbi:anthocyanin 5-aromatic acyltransferase [Phtheirospermum japonicum]|uniref:Anthocyanin 5-aromatic acyltransferase n=1 Tax=Phtheirospermum japonicum TaxID=374723 RepID=A0A830B5N9_9LAMI|nr:anthocyanin 5-aromatic acyltransferase [Phtheirospermum japonicum]